MTRRLPRLLLVALLLFAPGVPPARTADDIPSGVSIRPHAGWVSAVAFSPDGSRLAAAGDDGFLRVLDSRTGRGLASYRGDAPLTAVAWSGSRLAVGDWSGAVTIRDADGRVLLSPKGHKESVTAVAFCPDGSRLATGSADDSLRVWDAATGKQLVAVELDDDYDVTCLAWSPDGKRLAFGDGEKRLTVIDAESGDEAYSVEGHDAAVGAVAWSADGKRIASGAWDGSVVVRDAESGKALYPVKGHTSAVTALAFSADDRKVVTADESGDVRVADGTGLRGHAGKVTSLAVAKDGRIASAGKGLILVRADAAEDEFTAKVKPFLAKHCVSCHGPTKQTFGVRLDGLDGFKPEQSPLWTKVHEVLANGSMPPAGRPQPADGDRAAVLKWVEDSQRSSDRGGLRRLNRRELSALLRDATGLPIDFAHGLPADGKLAGLDTGADALQDAADGVETQMKVTRRAVDAIRFMGPAKSKSFAADLTAVKDARKAFDSWKDAGATIKFKGVAAPGRGLLMEPRWVGEREVHSVTIPAPPGNRGVLRIKLTLAALRDHFPGLPAPRLWVQVGGTDLAFDEITATPDKPAEREYFVQLDDLAVGSKGVNVNLSCRVEIPYAVAGFENEEVNKTGEPIPGGTGFYRPTLDRKLPPEKQPAPWLLIKRIEIESGYVAPWGVIVGKGEEDAAKLLAAWADRAWRRPTTDKEREPFAKLFTSLRAKGETFDDALRGAFHAVLMSANARYLPPASESQHALASRLSFALWGTPPDETLRALAASGKLREAKALGGQIDRLLTDPRADGFFRPFTTQWLELEQPITIASTSLRKQDFRFARYLKESMREETIRYVGGLFADDRPAAELVKSDRTFMNDALAIHYGYPGVTGGHVRAVTLRKDDPRGGGILGHAGIQSMLTWMGGNWVIYRGAWAMRHVLDDPPPPPPLEVPELNPADKANRGKDFRRLLKQHQEDANCSVCHKKMDPLGFAFQNFDLSGRWRDKEYESYHMADLDGKIEWRGVGDSRPVDSAGKLPRGEAFSTFAECKDLIAAKYRADVARGMLKNLVVWSAGRLPDVRDMAAIRRVLKEHEAKGYPLRAMTREVLRYAYEVP